ncbi:MAG: non-heme iron oxygenase ferredoxin subunit [Pseudomonadota bacterium]
MTTEFVKVAAVDEIPPGKFRCVKIGENGLVVANVKGAFHAVENLCSHGLATFDDGRLRGPRLMCPLHGGTFDIRDGSAKGKPATVPIRSFETRIVDGNVEVCVD